MQGNSKLDTVQAILAIASIVMMLLYISIIICTTCFHRLHCRRPSVTLRPLSKSTIKMNNSFPPAYTETV